MHVMIESYILVVGEPMERIIHPGTTNHEFRRPRIRDELLSFAVFSAVSKTFAYLHVEHAYTALMSCWVTNFIHCREEGDSVRYLS